MVYSKTLHFRLEKVLFSALKIVLFSLCAACTPVLNNSDVIKPGNSILKADSTINGMRRTSLVHIPENFDPESSYPLVVVIHGAFSTAAKMEEESGFSALADRENFVVLYPNGMGLFGYLQHWNAGHCCGKAVKDGLDDVGFLQESIVDISERINIDPRRIYMVGFSNGGMMAYRYAAERGKNIAAFAVLAASVGGSAAPGEPRWIAPAPDTPVPVMIIHGLDDIAVPPQGGVSPKKKGTRQYLSLEGSLRFWLDSNGCSGQPQLERIQNGNVSVSFWDECIDKSTVALVTIKNWGHRWPGPYYTKDDQNLVGFDASEMIWRFLQRHSR